MELNKYIRSYENLEKKYQVGKIYDGTVTKIVIMGHL